MAFKRFSKELLAYSRLSVNNHTFGTCNCDIFIHFPCCLLSKRWPEIVLNFQNMDSPWTINPNTNQVWLLNICKV